VGSVFKARDVQTQVDREGLPHGRPNPRLGDVLNSPTGLKGDPRSQDRYGPDLAADDVARLGLASLAKRNLDIEVASATPFRGGDWAHGDDTAPMQWFVRDNEASTRAALLVAFMRIEIER
jgi:hypothetical protein